MEFFLFIVTAVIAVASALMVITGKKPISSVLFLVLTFFCLAFQYVILGAQFIAALQIIVYAGAIMVLFLFVVMLLNLKDEQSWEVRTPARIGLGFAVAAGLFLVAITALKGLPPDSVALDPSMGTVDAVGDALFKRFLLPFEVISVLLLVAIIGVVTLVKPRQSKSVVEQEGKENG